MEKRYKVGEFSQNLGVSTGFLKHHETDGLLAPYVSSNGYRYYDYSQAMLALQCMRLQRIGFPGKEAADILLHSSQRNLAALLKNKIDTIQQDIIFDEEMIRCLEEIAVIPQDSPASCRSGISASDPASDLPEDLSANASANSTGHFSPALSANSSQDKAAPSVTESWRIDVPPSFYYLENSRDGAFLNDPQTYLPAQEWNRYVPMVTTGTRISLASSVLTGDLSRSFENGSLIREWAMGLCLRRDVAERLNIRIAEPARLVRPGKSLIWRAAGNYPLVSGEAHLRQAFEGPLRFCADHHFEIKSDPFCVDLFASTAAETNYRDRIIMIELC